MDMKQTLISGLPELKLDLTQAQTDTLCAFGQAVIDQNQVMNLTAITEPQQVAKLHLLDSLTVLSALDLRGKSLIDVGCGAGFPGVPLAIASPQTQVTLLDSLGKRVNWLKEILPQLGVSAQCITARAEEAVADRRESYDYAVSRAVARLNILLEENSFIRDSGTTARIGGHDSSSYGIRLFPRTCGVTLRGNAVSGCKYGMFVSSPAEEIVVEGMSFRIQLTEFHVNATSIHKLGFSLKTIRLSMLKLRKKSGDGNK